MNVSGNMNQEKELTPDEVKLIENINNQKGNSKKQLFADLLLIHAPAFFDFRNQSKVYFPYLSTSGDVPITPLYEYFPMGFKTLKRYLEERDINTRILNLSSLLLQYPDTDLEEVIRSMEVKVFGIDLHWMIHIQGSTEIASLIKRIHPDSKIIFGGISSTYYADELIKYPFVDMVMRGYDTHKPMAILMDAIKNGGDLEKVPNLIWKNREGEIKENPFSYTPVNFSYGINWRDVPKSKDSSMFPIKEVLSTSNAGCKYNCGWCGGSHDAFRRINKCDHSNAYKDLKEIGYEFSTMNCIEDIDTYHFYSCGAYNETEERMDYFLDQVTQTNLKSISFEQFFLTPERVLKRMAKTNKKVIITLSPESHDLRISKLAGRGVYSMEEMEKWIEKAVDIGINEINIWFFIGMPEQDKQSIFETVDYCDKLLKRFPGQGVIPLLCPMIPFLDPGSNFFENPQKYGYTTFFRTAQEHRQGMKRASLINRINYETKWLNRSELVYESYNAMRKLFEIKVERGLLPNAIVQNVIKRIDDAVEFLKVVHEIDCISDEKVRENELEKIAPEILKRNNGILFHGVSNQSLPINRTIGGRWFDEIPPEILI